MSTAATNWTFNLIDINTLALILRSPKKESQSTKKQLTNI
ncbi:hypothetical protein EMIT0194MI4_20199 [Pseudomonas sp. IT-194MI4]